MRENDTKLVGLIFKAQRPVAESYVPDEFDNFSNELSDHLHSHFAFREAHSAIENAGMSDAAKSEAHKSATLSYNEAKAHWDAHPQHHEDIAGPVGNGFGDVYDDVAQSHREITTSDDKDNRGHYTHNGWNFNEGFGPHARN